MPRKQSVDQSADLDDDPLELRFAIKRLKQNAYFVQESSTDSLPDPSSSFFVTSIIIIEHSPMSTGAQSVFEEQPQHILRVLAFSRRNLQ